MISGFQALWQIWEQVVPGFQGAADGTGTCDRLIPADLRTALLSTVPPTPRLQAGRKLSQRSDDEIMINIAKQVETKERKQI
ncbi:hypothetical protein PoB_004725300 [Plakobranchus ocellatus]|uniref:Uncharacterized protein n=1 Tax=Plakobranchus ocellatus TaxID=259542 RepID=A0AAV4BNP6_9GAST|nr:hypothetical protein PoB_004725300 [Plakobranchus ocellatus]